MHSPAFVRQGSPQAVCTGSLQDPPQTGTFIVNTSTDSVATIQMAQGDESHSSERCTTPPGQGSPHKQVTGSLQDPPLPGTSAQTRCPPPG